MSSVSEVSVTFWTPVLVTPTENVNDPPGSGRVNGLAVFTTSMAGGATTAWADIERSVLPRLLRFHEIVRMWYGEPLMPPAERGTPALKPQSSRLPMWPPQARTASGLVTVKVTLIRVSDC